MSSITNQQAKLDLDLVPMEKRLEIGKCNGRLNPGKTQREPTFKMDRKKKFDLNMEIFKDIFQICPRVHGQNFDEPPTDDVIVSFFKELGHTGDIKSITDIVVDQMHQPWRTFATIINRNQSGKTTGLDKLRLSRAQILWGMYYKKNVDYVELLWEDFTYHIDNRGHKKQEKMYYPRLTKVIIHYFLTKDKTVSRRNKIGMHTSRVDYLINTLRFVSAKEESQIYGALLPKSMTSPEMKETKAYKTYLGYATGVTPPKKAQKFKKSASPKLTTIPVSTEEPTGKSKRLKRSTKKSSNVPTEGVVIRDTPEMSLSKKKEKMTVEKRKGNNLLSELALIEEAQFKEVRKKILRDFYKNHPSGSGSVTSAAKIKPSVTNEGTEKGSDFEHETDENETGSESDQEENEEEVEDDEEENDDEFVSTPSNSTDDEDETDEESKVKDKAEGDEDKGMDYTTNQFDDDVDERLNKPVNTNEGFIQKEGTDAEMINIQQGNENLEITLNQVIEDAHVTISTVAKKTKVPVTSSSHSSDLASKFLNFSDIPWMQKFFIQWMFMSIMKYQAIKQLHSLQVLALEKEDAKLKKDNLLNTQVTALVDEHLDSSLGATKDEFMRYLSVSITARITEQVKIQLPQILPNEVSNFAPLNKDKDEDPSAGPDRGLKKKKTSKDDEPTKGPKAKEVKSGSSKGTKSQSKSSGNSVQAEGTEFVVADSKMPQDQKENLGDDVEEPKRKGVSKRDWFTKPKPPQEPTDPDWNVGKTPQQGPTQSWLITLASSTNKPSKTFDDLMSTPIDFSAYIMNGLKITNLTQETLVGLAFKLLKGTGTNFTELEYDFEECYKALSEKLDWENPKGGDYPFDLTKPLPLVINGNRQMVLVDYFFNNDLKYLQGGISTMTYTMSITKTKAAQYDLPGIEEMTFYAYARGLESSHDVYSTKLILAVTRVEVMRKHRYGYLREIEVRRANNNLYTFKEGDFPRLRINDIEDMLLLVVQNRLTNLSGDDVFDFAIALRMFTRRMVIQKRVEDLQLGVESYQKKINVTKPETTRPGIKKRDPYTPYQDPQGFIYVDNQGRNRLMRSDELYKFSDSTLTRLQTVREDITKNIQMEYLPKRKWSSLENKRAHIMIKAIDKLLKERRMMGSLEKFVGGRHNETDLRLLQRTI
ncbi:hypothetical protein Tco_1242878 [Tanacetum coccineum]